MADLLTEIKDISRWIGIKPRHSQGQNFLVSEEIYDFIIQGADLKKDDLVLEVGPGLGFLTTRLAQKVHQVIAVELDSKLAQYLQLGKEKAKLTNLEIVNQDILKFNPLKYGLRDFNYKIVANLPYNITSLFLRNFLTNSFRPQSLTLMLQQEVVERIIAKTPQLSVLALSVQYYAQAKLLKIIKADNFWPKPKVNSALLQLKLYKTPLSLEKDKQFFRLIKIGFSSKRKMLKNNLSSALKISNSKLSEIFLQQSLSPNVRAQELSLQQWQRLFAALAFFMI